MKRIASLVIRIGLTVSLFVMIFVELGAKYLPVDPSLLARPDGGGILFARPKVMLARFRHVAPPSAVSAGDVCGLATGKAFLVRVGGGDGAPGADRYLPLDTDLGCVGGKLQLFTREGNEWRRVGLAEAGAEAARGVDVDLKTRGWWRVAPITPRDLWVEVKSLDPATFWPWIAFAVVVKLAGIFASLWRWQILLVGQGIHIPFRYLCGTFFTGRFFGIVLPSTLGLDAYRLYDSIRLTKKPVECTTVIAVEKVIGFVAVFGLVFLTLPLGRNLLDIRKPALLFAMLGGLGAFILLALLVLFSPRFVQAIFRVAPIPMKKKIQSKLDSIVVSATAYADHRAVLAWAIFLGFVVHGTTILMYFGAMRAVMTTGVKMSELLFASSLTITGTVFGPTLGGAGIREIMFTWLLKDSAGAAKAFLFGHLGFWLEKFFLSIPGGLVYLLRPAAYKPKLTVEDLKQVE